MAIFTPIILVTIAYLIGSIASAILICKLFRLDDPRNEGSGNPGATNMMRLHGKKLAILTLTGDVLKGVIPVLLAKFFGSSELIISLCGLATLLGHLFPIFFNFKGGKGVATLIGALLALHWLLGLAYVATWGLTAFLFRYSSLAALIASLLTPLYTWLILKSVNVLIPNSIMVVLLLWRHRSNIRNLITGREDKLGKERIRRKY